MVAHTDICYSSTISDTIAAVEKIALQEDTH